MRLFLQKKQKTAPKLKHQAESDILFMKAKERYPMTKVTMRYKDGLVNSIIVDDITSISEIVQQVQTSCLQHNSEFPEFDFEDWELQNTTQRR